MRIKFKKGEQKKLILFAINKAGTERKLSKLINLSKGSIYGYKHEIRTLPEERFKKLLNFLNLKEEDFAIDSILDNNWGQKLGGKAVVLSKKAKNTFNRDMDRLKQLSSIRMKKWHREMKQTNPEFYYKLQYKRFKKIRKHPFLITKNRVRVRNSFEKEVADFLYENKISFIYEPYVNINKKAYFPDFVIGNNILIEVTAWKHPDTFRLSYLKKKIKDYISCKYQIIFYIPKQYRNFYKEIDEFIISDLETLKSKIMPS